MQPFVSCSFDLTPCFVHDLFVYIMLSTHLNKVMFIFVYLYLYLFINLVRVAFSPNQLINTIRCQGLAIALHRFRLKLL